MEMMELPDDVLVAVLAYLPAKELLSGRLVCRRLRDLCLHREAWKTVSVSGFDEGVLRTALRLAPCVHELTLVPKQIGRVAPLVSGTTCVVSSLTIGSFWEPDDITQDTVAIVERISSLGGLRTLHLCLSEDFASSAFERVLLHTIHSMRDLQYLFINCEGPLSPGASFDVEVTASLTTLIYRSSGLDFNPSNPFVDSLLRAHAATLETVILELRDVPMPLLKAMPKLRHLGCYSRDDLPDLLESPSLAEIELQDHGSKAFPAGTVSFFQRAAHLRSVAFWLPDEDPTSAFLALAGSEAARGLKTLNLITSKSTDEDLTVVASRLHQFPSLQSLTLPNVTNDFLRAISPACLPRLTTLTTEALHDGLECVHAWLHGPAVQHLLARNPRLHLELQSWRSIADDCSCVWCVWGCHMVLKEDGVSRFVYSGHPQRDCWKPGVCMDVVTLNM